MFYPRKVFKLEDEIENSNKKEFRKYSETLKKLSFFRCNRLRKLRFKKEEIIRLIERDSSWRHVDNSFIYKSDFRYNYQTFDIDYVLNKVSYNDDENYNEKERAFYDKYHLLLSKLNRYKEAMDIIYSLEETKKASVVDISSIKMRHTYKNSSEKANEFIQMKADYLLDEYGIEGIVDLVKILNEFDKNDDTKNVYDRFMRSNKSNKYKEDMKEWISTYSSKCQNYIEMLMLSSSFTNSNAELDRIILDNEIKILKMM